MYAEACIFPSLQGAAISLMRDEVENCGLDFQGLILFRNELKPDTRQVSRGCNPTPRRQLAVHPGVDRKV